MDQLTDVAEGLNPLLPCQSLLSLSRVHYKKNMSGDASPAQDEKTLPCFISSNRLRHCGSFPSENTPGHAEQEASRSRHLSRQKSPMLRMLRGALGISLKSPSSELQCGSTPRINQFAREPHSVKGWKTKILPEEITMFRASGLCLHGNAVLTIKRPSRALKSPDNRPCRCLPPR